jgi:hypothetical protein
MSAIRGADQHFWGFRTPAMTREQAKGRVLLGMFEVGLGVLLIIIDAMGPVSKLLAGGWAFIRSQDLTHRRSCWSAWRPWRHWMPLPPRG